MFHFRRRFVMQVTGRFTARSAPCSGQINWIGACRWFVLALGLFAATGGRASAQAAPTAVFDGSEGRVDIGGRGLYLECRGSGGPTVILESGAGNDARIWSTLEPPDTSLPTVLESVASFTRVCAYDRPGTMLDLSLRSRSDPVPMPRTADEVVADLHALLGAAGVVPPYVFVGHSFGGMVVRLYASEYPDEVAGLVLVDAGEEGYFLRLGEQLTPDQRAFFEALPREFADYPEFERLDIFASAAQLQRAASGRPLRSMPLYVLARGRALEGAPPMEVVPTEVAAQLESDWATAQRRLAALVPNAHFVVATQSGHYIQLDEPELVIDAIRDIVDAVRALGTPVQLPR
jgi:pimeloyl-ACP methyl ester carboxylesterase